MLTYLLSNLLYIGARDYEQRKQEAQKKAEEVVQKYEEGKISTEEAKQELEGLQSGSQYNKVDLGDVAEKVTNPEIRQEIDPAIEEQRAPQHYGSTVDPKDVTYYYNEETGTKTYRVGEPSAEMKEKIAKGETIPITKAQYESQKPLEVKEETKETVIVRTVDKETGEVGEWQPPKSIVPEDFVGTVIVEPKLPEIKITEEEPKEKKPSTRAELFSPKAREAFGIKEEGGMLVLEQTGRKRYYTEYDISVGDKLLRQSALIADVPVSATYRKGFESRLGTGEKVKPLLEDGQLRKIELGDIFRVEKTIIDKLFDIKKGIVTKISEIKTMEVSTKPLLTKEKGVFQLRKIELPEDILRLKEKYPSVYEDIKKGAIYPLKLAKSIFYDIPSQFLAYPSKKIGKVGREIVTKSIVGYEWAIEKLNKSEYNQLTEPITKSLRFGKEITKVTKGFFEEFEEHPKRTYPLIMGGALATELLGSLVTSKLATTGLGEKIIPPAIKGITTGLGLTYAGTVIVELDVTPKEERAELLGKRLQPISLLWLGSTVATKLKLKDIAFKSVFEKTKYAGLSESQAKQYWMAEEGKPLITSQKMKYQILGRELAIQEWPQFKTPAGEAFIQTGLEAKEFWKLSQESGLSFLKSSVFYKDVVKKTELDFSLVERIKPLGIKAPLIMAGVSATYPKLVTGGSLVPASVFKKEFKIFEITPHDIDQYISGSTKGLVEWEYKALGGKQIPKRIDIDVRPVLDIYKQKALEIIKKRGGRVTGATALQLQVKDFGRIARDIDVEFKKDITGYKLTTTSLEKAPSTILKDLEKEFGKRLFEIEEGRHKKIIWSEDLGLYKKGETFLDIGKWREGYRTRTLKGLKVTHVLDVLEDKKAIAKYLKEPIEKVAKAQRDILATRKGLADLYKFGVLRIDEDKLFTRPLTEIKKWDKFIEAHSLKEMLYPNIMSVSPLYRTPKSYLLKTKTRARVLSPEIQQRRAIMGAFADLRYKDIFKFIPMKLGELGLAETRAKSSVFEAFRLRDIMKKRDILAELTKGRMFRLASIEAGIEKLSEKQISLLIGGKKKKVIFPKAGELDIFEKTYGKEATEKLFETKDFKRLGERDYVEQILREKKPKIKSYPSYKKYFALPYPLYHKPLYEQYWPYKHPYKQYISYTPYKKPYKPYTSYKPYESYKPYQQYPLYEPYKGYKPYKPYKPYAPYKPYQPYKPYAPYSHYKAYEVYEPIIPPILDFKIFPSRPRKKKKELKQPTYNVYAREKGKFIKLNKKPLPEKKALNLGADVVDNTASATFKIKKTDKKVSLKDDFFFNKKAKFRKKDNTYTELNQHRIDSVGEIQGITVKGWLAHRKGALRL